LHKKHSEKRVKAKVEKKKKRTALQMQKSHGMSSRAGIRKDNNGFVADRHHPSSEFFLPMKKPERM
jgi:hypothetical protein